MLRKKGGLGCCKKKGECSFVCACRRRKNEWGFQVLYVINASSIIIEYVSKCLASLHTSVKSVREKKHSAVMGTQIAQITQIFMLLAAQLGVSALP